MSSRISFLKTIALLAVLISSISYGQRKTKKVLFLGNSYTFVNELPQLISNVAASAGDSLEWVRETPGGSFLYDHWVSTKSTDLIKVGDWDYVVLQDQSQAPTLPDYQIAGVFKYARMLDSLVHAYNTCASTVFYMTWGRKNGDSVFYNVYSPWYREATYEFMDSLLHDRYMQMGTMNNAEVSPVGAVWKYIRQNHPNIELYQADESHPSLAGSYVAACTFYATLFRKDPTLASFNPGLSSFEATTIQNAAKLLVYDSLLKWNIGRYDSLKSKECLIANIEEIRKGTDWNVYPNPATSALIVEFSKANKSEEISIYNALGELMGKSAGISPIQIDITSLPKGMYFIQSKNNPNKTLKFYKQ